MTEVVIRLERHLDGTVIARALEEGELVLLEVARSDKYLAYRDCRSRVVRMLPEDVEFRTDDQTGDL